MKRTFDLFTSIIVLILLVPFMTLLILIYGVSGNLTILFSQDRLGLKESEFKLLKFRTLKADENLSLQDRSFALGNWLRRTSLDELPQLINVIKGDMSLVGPRPLPTFYESLFSKEQRQRFQVKPGITGLTQINGGSKLTWPEKFDYDIEYVNNHSFWVDISILFKTIGVIFIKKDDGLQEKPFTGES
jgi:undecaprenyl phosphate N,N'-diacetylbacillosamine 1-phosphate transferase